MIAPLDRERAATPPSKRPTSALRLQLSGVPGAWLDGRWVAFRADKRYLLLAHLALAADWVSRERLADLFWPDSGTDKALCNLRQLLMRVTALEWTQALERDHDRLRWVVATDLQDMEAAARRGDPEAALRHVSGAFLDGLACDDSAAVTSWLALERERLTDRCRSLRLEWASDLARAGMHGRAAAVLEDVLTADALDEEATFAYMQVAVTSGRPLQALRAYHKFSRRLNDELRMEPCRCTSRLADEIRLGGGAGRPAPFMVGQAFAATWST